MANPLLSRWSGPHGGVPPFDQVAVEHFQPALDAAMEECLAEIDRIAGDPAPPDFENTIAAFERAGRTLDRARRVYSVFSSTLRSPAFQQVEREMEPKMAAFRDRILQNAKLFERISAVYATRASSQLTAEQQRLVWLKYTDFARGGARLETGAKKRLSEINQRLASLYTQFSQNVLADESTALILEIMRLRGERAKLLGYESHAHWRLEVSMAKTPERATELMEAVWRPAVKRVAEEVADMQAEANREGAGITIEPWDYRYYAEKVRKSKYDIDDNEVMPYLQLENLREAMFWVAGELLGLRFVAAPEVPVCHPDVRVWEVRDDAGKHVAYFYFDPYARRDKRSGAWMNEYRSQERFDGEVTTIVSNNSNFVKGKPGEPVLVSWHDAVTLFHEFGHGLHGLSSNVTYPSLAGTNVDRDYVEFPSQLMEHWLATPEVLGKYARHCVTGEPIPEELVRRIERASKFNKGFENVEYLASALVDMRMHLDPASAQDVASFERTTLAALGMPRQMAMRHRLPHFGHLFNSDSYAAGYYSYLWADTLSADAFEAFTEAGGAYDKSVARKLHDYVFSAGNTVDPAEGYRAFRGRDAQIDALMRRRGFGESLATRTQ